MKGELSARYIFIREFMQPRWLRQIKRHLRINICAMETILRLLLPFLIVDKLRYRWTGRSAVVLNRENERFTIVCLRCR